MAGPKKRFATAKEFQEYHGSLKKAGKLDEAETLRPL